MACKYFFCYSTVKLPYFSHVKTSSFLLINTPSRHRDAHVPVENRGYCSGKILPQNFQIVKSKIVINDKCYL